MVGAGSTNEIGELNLAYLLLAKRLVRDDVATAMFRLGMSRELADLLGNLSLSQIVKLATSSLFLCRQTIQRAGVPCGFSPRRWWRRFNRAVNLESPARVDYQANVGAKK